MIRSNNETQERFKWRSRDAKTKKKYLLAEDNKWLCENKTQPKPTKAKQNPPELFYRDVTRK